MTLRRTAVVVTLLVAVTAAVYAAGRPSTPLRPGEYEVEGKIFGMPEAEVFVDDYSGPPVVGEYVTHLPNLAVPRRTSRRRFRPPCRCIIRSTSMPPPSHLMTNGG